MSVTVSRPGSSQVLRPQSFHELSQFASMAAKSQMVPTAFRNKPEDIMLAVQMGSELGLSPMQALQNIAVINNRPSVWGDAMPGLCRASAVCEDIVERFEGDGDKLTAMCIAKRRGSEPTISTFSVDDAKKAGLWGKPGPWQQYPRRMLQMRARGFALRDAFPDVLKGLIAAEEAQDIPAEGASQFSGTTIDSTATPAPQPPPGGDSRDALNASVPLSDAPKKRTVGDWLDNTEIALVAAQTVVDVDAIVTSEEVQKALTSLKNGALDRLNAMVRAATDRVAPGVDEGDDFPGDRAAA